MTTTERTLPSFATLRDELTGRLVEPDAADYD